MSNFDHISDLVGAREKIQNLQQRLDTAKADLDKWMVTFSVEVVPTTFDLFVQAKLGNRGTTFTLKAEEIISFAADLDTLSNIIADKALNALLQDQVRLELRDEFVRGCKNIVKLNTRSSL